MDDFNKANALGDEVIKTAEKISTLGTEALAASAAGFTVIALLFWNVFWIFAAMAIAILLLRSIGLLAGRQNLKAMSERELYDWVMERKKKLWASHLPQIEKVRASQQLDLMLKPIDVVAVSRQLSAAPGEDELSSG